VARGQWAGEGAAPYASASPTPIGGRIRRSAGGNLARRGRRWEAVGSELAGGQRAAGRQAQAAASVGQAWKAGGRWAGAGGGWAWGPMRQEAGGRRGDGEMRPAGRVKGERVKDKDEDAAVIKKKPVSPPQADKGLSASQGLNRPSRPTAHRPLEVR
jgi:hypothetical protein